jgi:hypothetical protein
MGMFRDMADQWMRENMPLVELTKPSASAMALHDPAEWREDFSRWAISRCVFRDRSFGGIAALWRDFCEFQVSRNEVPCTRNTFEALIRDAGFLFVEGLICGLLLKADLHAMEGDTRCSRPHPRGKRRSNDQQQRNDKQPERVATP